MAVAFFEVEVEVIRVLFIYSIGFVALMVGIGFLLFPLITLFRKKPSSLLDGSGLEEEPVKPEDSEKH